MHLIPPSRTHGRALLREHLLFAIGHFVACLIGLLAKDPLTSVLCFWPAAGTALVAVTRLGWRTLPALALVQIAASLLGAPILAPVQILILCLGCSLQAWTGAALMLGAGMPTILSAPPKNTESTLGSG